MRGMTGTDRSEWLRQQVDADERNARGDPRGLDRADAQRGILDWLDSYDACARGDGFPDSDDVRSYLAVLFFAGRPGYADEWQP